MAAPTDPTSAPTQPFKVSANAPKISLTPPTASEPPLNGPTSNPNAVSLANFINDAHSAGYGAMDPNIIATIGHQMGNNNNSKMALAVTKQGLAIPNKTSQFLFEPSAVAPDQTTSKVIQDHIKNTGIAPVPSAQIKAMQQQLINASQDGHKGAYAPGNAIADGIWNADWANAAYQYNLDLKSKPGLGNSSARNIFSTIFNTGFLSYAIPFVSSIIKSVPGDALKALGGGLKLTTDAIDAFDKFVAGNGAAGKSQAVHIANWLSNVGQKIEGQAPLTDTQYGAQSNWEHALAIGNTALTLATLGAGGVEIKLATEGALAAGRAAGAKTTLGALFTKVEPMAPKGPLNWVMNSVLPNTSDGNARLAFTRWLQNSPSASKFTQDLTQSLNGGATDVKNAYKVARRTLAAPYRLPITAIAGQALSATSTAGLKFGLQGHADNWMGDPNAPVATELNHLKPIAGITGLGLNLLQGVSHGDTGIVPALSERTGNVFTQARSGIATALNKSGLLADFERGTGMSVNKFTKQLTKEGVPVSAFYSHVLEQADNFAASHAAQTIVDSDIQKGIIDKNNADQIHLNQLNQEHIIRQDPALWEQARESYSLKPGLFAKDMSNAMLRFREDSRKVYSKDLISKLKADEVTRNKFLPAMEHVITPTPPVEDTSWMSQGLADHTATYPNARTTPMSPAEVIQVAKDSLQPITKNQLARMQLLMKSQGLSNRDEALKYVSQVVGHDVASRSNLTTGEADRVIKKLLPAKSVVQGKQAALAGEPITGKLGLMRDGLPTAEDAQTKAMEFAQELQKARPGYVAPSSIDELKQSSGADFGGLSKPWQMPRTHQPELATSAEVALRAKVMDFLGSELGRNIRDLSYVPTQDLIKLIAEKSNLLAHSVTIAASAPQHLIDAVNEAKALGYKHVWGTDIGHVYNQAPVDLDRLGVQQNLISHTLDKIGVNFTPMSDEVSVSSISGKNGMNDVIDKKKAQDPSSLPIWATGSNIMEFLQSVIRPKMSGIAGSAIEVSSSRIGKLVTFKGMNAADGGTFKNELEALIKKGHYTDVSGKDYPIDNMRDAKNVLKKILAEDSSPQSWTRKDFINALTHKGDANGMMKNKFGQPTEAVGMSVKDASDLWYGMKKGLRSAPAYHGGFNPISRMMNSTLGFSNIPIAVSGKRLLDLTGNVQGALIKARYLYSPRQAYLRAVKSALKGVNENMPYSLNADASFRELPKADQEFANALTDKLYGKDQTALDLNDFSTKEFGQSDYFNIFNARAALARTVHYVSQNMKEEGKPLDTLAGQSELKNRVDAINNYGDRSSAEKTLNAFFFPFSFEKTVARELGAHLLDNPSTRLMTAGAIHLYNSTDGKKMDKWLQDNLPLFKEAEKFNPFYHGEGLGQLGGINRVPEGIIGKFLYGGKTTGVPDFSGHSDSEKLGLFLHMMTPKPITGQASLQATINLIPAIKDLNNIFVGYDPNGKKPLSKTAGGEVWATVLDLAHQANSAVHTFMGQTNTAPYQGQGYQPYDLQQTNAWALRSKYITGLLPALQANSSGGSVAFLPETPAVGGLKVTRSNIDKLVAQIYPDWNPNLASYSVARDTAATQERVNIQKDVKKVGPNLLTMYDNFVAGSNTVQTEVQKGALDPTFDPAIIANDMATLRYWASYLAAADTSFPSFYAKYYAAKYGPLKGL